MWENDLWFLFHMLSFCISENGSTVTLEKQWQILSFERIVYSEILGSVFMTDSYLLVASVYLLNEQIKMNNKFYFQSHRKKPLFFTICCLICLPEWAHAFKHCFYLLIYSSKECTTCDKELRYKTHGHRKW